METNMTKEEGFSLLENLRKYLLERWGECCPDYSENCLLCKVWETFSYIEEDIEEQFSKLPSINETGDES